MGAKMEQENTGMADRQGLQARLTYLEFDDATFTENIAAAFEGLELSIYYIQTLVVRIVIHRRQFIFIRGLRNMFSFTAKRTILCSAKHIKWLSPCRMKINSGFCGPVIVEFQDDPGVQAFKASLNR